MFSKESYTIVSLQIKLLKQLFFGTADICQYQRGATNCISSYTIEKRMQLSILDFTRASIFTLFNMKFNSTQKHVSKTTSKLLLSKRNPWWTPVYPPTLKPRSITRKSNDIPTDFSCRVLTYCVERFISLTVLQLLWVPAVFFSSITVIIRYSICIYVIYYSVHVAFHSAVIVFGYCKTYHVIYKCIFLEPYLSIIYYYFTVVALLLLLFLAINRISSFHADW